MLDLLMVWILLFLQSQVSCNNEHLLYVAESNPFLVNETF